MSNDVRGLLHGAATVPSAGANVAAAWNRGRRMRTQRLVAGGFAILAVVAMGSVAVAKVVSGHDTRSPVVPITRVTTPAPPCLEQNLRDIPAWARSANPPLAVPHTLTSDGNVLAFVFSDPMVSGHPTSRQNKILWIVRLPRDGKPLAITATLPGSDVAPVHRSIPAGSSPGEIYPSVIDVPAPGCWHFELSWNGHHSAIDLGYSTLDVPTTTTTTSTTTTAPVSTTPQCRTANLTITVGPANGAAGTEYFQISFRNNAPTACRLSGYPGVSFLDASGAQIGLPEDRNVMAHSPVDLAPGATAYALAGVGNPDMVNCPAAIPRSVRIYPPNETAFVIIDAPLGVRVCNAQRAPGFVGPVTDKAN